MILWLRNIIAYFVCAIASVAVTNWIGSTVVNDLLIPNLLTIVIALLAINVQTTAVISVKLRELADRHNSGFRATVSQFRLAIYEQASLALASLVLSALMKSEIASNAPMAVDIAAFFVFYATLHIFLDTTVSLLYALFPED